jgi:hypothetical protein
MNSYYDGLIFNDKGDITLSTSVSTLPQLISQGGSWPLTCTWGFTLKTLPVGGGYPWQFKLTGQNPSSRSGTWVDPGLTVGDEDFTDRYNIRLTDSSSGGGSLDIYNCRNTIGKRPTAVYVPGTTVQIGSGGVDISWTIQATTSVSSSGRYLGDGLTVFVAQTLNIYDSWDPGNTGSISWGFAVTNSTNFELE